MSESNPPSRAPWSPSLGGQPTTVRIDRGGADAEGPMTKLPPNCRRVTGEGVMTFVGARLWWKLGLCIAIAVALAAVASSPPAAAALGIHIGPFHLGLGSH